MLGDTFISYSNHFNSARTGNWWWQQIHEASTTDTHSGYFASYNGNDVGGNRPEMGAGSVTSGADINVIAKGSVEVKGGGRTNGGAYIGHGGDSGGWGDHYSMRDERLLSGQTPYYYTVNGASSTRSSISIGRLAGVYGDINVLAGVDEVSAINAEGDLVATFTDRGNVILEGLQRMGASNAPGNENNGAGSRSMVLIGHGGVGQFGVFEGDVTVEAGGGVTVKAGSQTGDSAVIGHNVTNFAYWNPTDNVNQQIRFFSSAEDFDDPLLRRGVLFSTSPTNIPSQTLAGDTFSGNRPRALSGEISTFNTGNEIEALDGSVVKGFHGDISVTAYNGDIDVIAYSTPDRSDGTIGVVDGDVATAVNGLETNRDRRYAMIGHGGSTDSTWSEHSGYVPNRTDRNAELVQFRIPNGDSGSAGIIGEVGGGRNRALTFMTITGDVDVNASGDLMVKGGNDTYDFSKVGHGGADLADFETSSFINGDINVNVGGAIDVLGGGEVMYTGNANNRQIRAFSMIGHGGFSTGFTGFYGDINVNAGSEIDLTGGKYDYTFAKIGHQGGQDYGQVGGDFLRNENFDFDSAQTDITVEISGSTATVTYAAVNATGLTGVAPTTYDDISTTNVSVVSGGGITMNHLGEGVGFNDNQDFRNRNRAQTLDMVDIAPVQIGHGGNLTAGLNRGNPENDFANKIGDITVLANGGDIRLENGNGDQRWTRIGHGVGRGDRGDFGGNSMEFTGDIRVEASGSVILDAGAADSYGMQVNADSESIPRFLLDIGDPSRWNPVAIGHGGAYDNYGLIVVDEGQVSGVAASADIDVVAGADITVDGGVGKEGTSAQIGHGFSVFLGNSNANRKNGLPDGFAGDISVSAARDLSVTGGDLAFLLEPLATDDQAISIVGAFGAIGHGGFGVDAEANGDINVYVGNNLRVEAQQRTQAGATNVGTSYVYTPPTATGQPSNVASLFNFAKIGHSNAENGNAQGNLGDAIVNAGQSGDIMVVVNGNFDLVGGTTTDESSAPIVGAFAQVGHGGPGIAGDGFDGNITVLVQNNLTTTGGTLSNDSIVGLNNYTMIGNGDRVRPDVGVGQASVFYSESFGNRSGNITVAVGDSAAFTGTLIGHKDPATSSQPTSGFTQVAVSRNDPFFGGTGTLTSTGSVFSSGSGGSERLEFYMPARSGNLIDDQTRINEVSAVYSSGTPDDFVGLDGSGTETSGRADEVYLTPDLWWDASGVGSANGFTGGGVFPTDAVTGQGGSIAGVTTPGGFPNLSALTQGALGSSASTYRNANGVNGAGRYTFYYDAVETPSSSGSATGGGFPFIDFVFEEQFDSYDRYQVFLKKGLTGQGNDVYGTLGLFETDKEESGEMGAMRLENRLDNLVGERRDSFSDEELAEEEDFRRRRAEGGVGGIGLTFYVFEPGTNRYSSLRVFGTAFERFYPVN